MARPRPRKSTSSPVLSLGMRLVQGYSFPIDEMGRGLVSSANVLGSSPASARRKKAEPSDRQISPSAFEPGPRARALLRGIRMAEDDLRDSGGTYNQEQVRDLLNGITRQALEKRVREGSVLAVPGPSNRRRYPAVQFMQDGPIAGLKDVRDALPTRNPWAVLNFLIHPDPRLSGSKPINVLRNGDVPRVVAAARAMGQQGG